MLTVGIARIGNEPVTRFTQDGKAVLDLNLAFTYGRKGQDGKYPTQWVRASLWGERCEKLQPYLAKGNQVYAQLSDMHIEAYTKKDGTQAVDLRARIDNIQLIGGERRAEPAPHEQFQRPAQSNLGAMDDDIPF
jgi:single-strand DNA-binding protein